jgi:hypothetical protein
VAVTPCRLSIWWLSVVFANFCYEWILLQNCKKNWKYKNFHEQSTNQFVSFTNPFDDCLEDALPPLRVWRMLCWCSSLTASALPAWSCYSLDAFAMGLWLLSIGIFGGIVASFYRFGCRRTARLGVPLNSIGTLEATNYDGTHCRMLIRRWGTNPNRSQMQQSTGLHACMHVGINALCDALDRYDWRS